MSFLALLLPNTRNALRMLYFFLVWMARFACSQGGAGAEGLTGLGLIASDTACILLDKPRGQWAALTGERNFC